MMSTATCGTSGLQLAGRLNPALRPPAITFLDACASDIRRRSRRLPAADASGVQNLFTRLRREAGISVHPHVCPYTMSSRWIAAGVSPSVARRGLGHSSVRMVERYVHFDAAGLAAAARA